LTRSPSRHFKNWHLNYWYSLDSLKNDISTCQESLDTLKSQVLTRPIKTLKFQFFTRPPSRVLILTVQKLTSQLSKSLDSLKNDVSICWEALLKYFFGLPCSATLIFIIFLCVIASIAYIHPGVQTHDLLIMSHLP
jgi:hypothetical protein